MQTRFGSPAPEHGTRSGSAGGVFERFSVLQEGGGDFLHSVFDFADRGVDFLDEVVFGLGEAFDALGLFGDGLEDGILAAGDGEHPIEAEEPADEVKEAEKRVQGEYSWLPCRNAVQWIVGAGREIEMNCYAATRCK